MERLKDNIFVWENAMSVEWCEELITMFDHKIDLAESQGGDKDTDKLGIRIRENQKRIDTSCCMQDYGSFNKKTDELLNKLLSCVDEMRSEYPECGVPRASHWEFLECKMQRTPPGGGFSQWHYEQGTDWHTSRRWGVWMIYLNTVEKGGKTDFPNQGLSVKPEAGKIVIWPAAYTHPHRSAPDLEEWKYIVTGWFIYHARPDYANDPKINQKLIDVSFPEL